MARYPVGMKIYDNSWYTDFGFEPEQLADFLAETGINFVITQSQMLPMQSSAVPNTVNTAEPAKKRATIDLAFRAALKNKNIDYFACMNVGFDAESAKTHPEWLPVDQHGRLGEQIDWYVGLPLSNQEFLEQKASQLKNAVAQLQPEGVHLGFARWPGFWETWLAPMRRNDLREFCFGPTTLAQFCQAKNVDLPIENPVAAAQLINEKFRPDFTDWKCELTHAMIARMKTAVHATKPDAPIAINTVPFAPDEFDGATAEILGQSHNTLGTVVDIFEVMAYHQILKRNTDWPAKIAQSIRDLANQTTFCTLQTGTHYTDGMHKAAGRKKEVTAAELDRMVNAVRDTKIDGICFFTINDFLTGPESDAMTRVVKSI